MMISISTNYLIENSNNKSPSSHKNLPSSIDLSMKILNTIRNMQLLLMLFKPPKLQMLTTSSWKAILEPKMKTIMKVLTN